MLKSKSLRFQLVLTISLITALSILITNGIVFYFNSIELEQMIGKNLLNIAKTGVVAVEATFTRIFSAWNMPILKDLTKLWLTF